MKNIISTSRPLLVLLIFVFAIYVQAFAGNFTWNGTASTDWSTSTNWTPNGVPSSNDSVTIVTGSNNVHLASNTSIKLISINSGILDLQSYSLTVSGNATFTSGQVNNGILSMYGTATITFKGTQFGAKVYATGNSILLNGSTFNDSLSVVKKGTATDNGKGGNTFNSAVSIVDSANGILVLSDSFPDTFNSRLWLANRSTSKIYLAHRGSGNNFNGDVCFQGKNIWSNYYGTAAYNGNITFDTPNGEVYFGYSTGSASLANGKNLYTGTGGFSAGYLYFRNFVQSDSTLSISLTLTGTARLAFESGSSFKATFSASAPLLYLDGTRFLGITSITTTGSSNSTSLGGSYFAKATTIYHNPSSACTFTTGTSAPDTFASPVVIKNGIGTMSINKSLFQDSVTMKNLNSTTGSDRFYVANSGDAVFEGKLILDNALAGMNFGNSGGISTVVGTGSFSILSTFTGILTLKNFQYSSSDSVSILMNNASSKLILNSGVYFERPFSFYGRNIQLNGASFDSSVTITRYGTTGDVSSGGNTFGWNTIIKDSSSTAHNFILANSTGDKFDGNVTFIQKGTGVNIYPAYSESTFFSGDVVVESTTGMQFGANGGFSKFKAGSIQTIHRNGSGTIQFKKLEVDKKGNYVELATPITVTDSLNLFKYYLHSDSINLLTLSDNIKVTGGSDSSYIMGFVSKIGNDSFLFPLGSPELTHPYHPLGISAPSSTTDAFLSVLIPAQQNYGNEMDSTIENISACDYWKLYRTNGSSAVKVNLSWNYDDCILTKPTEMRVAGWNGTRWKDLGNSHSSGDSIIGNVTSLNTITQFGAFALSNNVCVTFETYPSTKNVSCYNYKNGYAKVIAQGGTPPYYYSWSDSLGFAYEISNLAPDTFIVNTTDVHGCLLTDTVHIYQPDSITVTFSTTSSVCKDSTGIAIVTPSGGTPPYNYLWSLSGNEDSTETNLKAGNYFVIVGDTNGCFKTYEAIVADTNGPVSTISVLSHVSCHGYRDGSAQISISSGKAPFHFEWLNSSDTDSVAVRLPAGTQSVKITDDDGCLSLDTLTITQPTALTVSLAITPSGCGQSNGEVTPTVSGGISPYAYHWTVSGSSEAEKKSVPQGIDTLIVEDLNKCRVNTTAIVSNSNGPTVSSTILSEIQCYDDTSGSILVTATGGTLPYSYNWFPSVSTTDTANNLWTGTYTVIVKDSNNCYGVSTITLDQPAPLQVNIYATNASSDSTNDGNAGSIILGGTLPYSYLWIPSGDSTPTALNLYAGIDTLVVTDANGCIDSSFFEISSTGCQNFHCDPYIDFSTIQTCSGGNNGNFTVIKDLHADFGANGDPESDRCAFEEAMNFFRNNLKPDRYNPNGPPRPGNGILTIPAGTFYVGYQYTPDVPCQWYLKGHDIMCMDGWQDFTIKGGNLDYAGQSPVTKIKYVDCLKFGAFDPITGDRWLSPPRSRLTTFLPLSDELGACGHPRQVGCVVAGGSWTRVAAYIGECIAMVDCNNVKIENLELDGNSDNIIYGGHYADGIQLPHDGIFIDHSLNITIKNVNAHHFGRDGLMIADQVCNFNPPPIGDNLNIRISKSKFNWNGRNGFSLVGGNGISVSSTEFNHNAVARLASNPGVGVDIEWEFGNTQIRSSNSGSVPAIEFHSCTFLYNSYSGIINESNQKDDIDSFPNPLVLPHPSRFDLFEKKFNFDHCIFVGSQNGYAAIPNGKSFSFQTCNFYGQVARSYFAPLELDIGLDEQTQFLNCTFNEIYNGKSINHQLVNECSTPVCGNTQNCVDARDQGLIHISYGARTVFEGCTFNSNFSMRWGFFSGHSTYAGTLLSDNKLELSACLFNNDGMNTQLCASTSCYTSLAEMRNVKVTHNTQFLILNGTVNTPTYCTQYTYYRMDYGQATCEPSGYSFDDTHIYTPAVCVPKYFNCRINPVEIYVADWFNCNDIVDEEACPNPYPYQRNAIKSALKQEELKISPNPSTHTIHVAGAESGEIMQILNVYGDCVKQELYLNSQHDILIGNLAPGIYFIRIENKLISKFIKLE